MSYEAVRRRQRQIASHQRQWETRHDNMRRNQSIMHCVCVNPISFKDGLGLRIYQTVQCGHCGRSIFDSDGKAVRDA